jgi:hypothetical protein
MNYYLLFTLAVPFIFSFGIVAYNVKHAAVGYEDETGFHEGMAPGEPRMSYEGPDRRRTESRSAHYSGPHRRCSDRHAATTA